MTTFNESLLGFYYHKHVNLQPTRTQGDRLDVVVNLELSEIQSLSPS